MADFDALIESLKAGTAPETIYDDLTLAHSTVLESTAAKLSETEAASAAAAEASAAAIAERDSEISRLKAMNYDLLMATPSGDDSPDDEEPESDDSEEDQSIDSLFDN